MGANQSAAGHQAHSSSGDNSNASGILVVNPNPGARLPEQKIVLPKRVPPILSIEGNRIDPARHRPELDQLDGQLWADLVTSLGEFLDSRADLTVARQNQLQEKITQIDDYVQRFTDSYVTGKHKALARLNDDCKRMEDIEKSLDKCTIQSELCISMLNKLNFLLPDQEKLESLEP